MKLNAMLVCCSSNQGTSGGNPPSSTPPIPRSQSQAMIPPSSQSAGAGQEPTTFPSRFGSPQQTPLQRPPTPHERSSTPQNQPPAQAAPSPMQTPGQQPRPPFTGPPSGMGQENYGNFPHGQSSSPSPAMYQGNKPGMYKTRPDFPRRDPSFNMQSKYMEFIDLWMNSGCLKLN